MEKILSFRDKIDIILSLRELSIKEFEKKLGVDGTIYKAYKENREPSKKMVEEIQRKFHVKQSWWKHPVGDDESAVFDRKLTSVQNRTDNSGNHLDLEDPREVYRRIMEGETEYVVIPRAIFEDKYKLVALEKIKQEEKMLDWLMTQNQRYADRILHLEAQSELIQKAKEKS